MDPKLPTVCGEQGSSCLPKPAPQDAHGLVVAGSGLPPARARGTCELLEQGTVWKSFGEDKDAIHGDSPMARFASKVKPGLS